MVEILCLTLAIKMPTSSALPNHRSAPVTVTDSIRERVIVAQDNTDPVTFSSNRAFFALVTERGSLQRDDVEATIDIFTTHGNKLLRTFRVASRTDSEPVQDLQWGAHSSELYFLGSTAAEPQVFRASIVTGAIEQVTHVQGQIASFTFGRDGKSIAYVMFPKLNNSAQHSPHYLTESQTFMTILPPAVNYEDAQLGYGLKRLNRWHFYQFFNRHYTACGDFRFLPGSMSPNGRYIVLLCAANEPPDSWIARFPQILRKGLKEFPSHLKQLVVFDTERAAVQPALNEPWTMIDYDYPSVRWGDDAHFFVADVFAPSGKPEVNLRPSLLSFTARGLQWVPEIVSQGPRLILFDAPSARELVLGTPSINPNFAPRPHLEIVRQGLKWVRVPLFAKSTAQVIVKQSLNSAPRLFAVSPRNKEHELLQLNPQFSRITFARVEPVKWYAKDGILWMGALYLPLHFHAGVRYPLVIQTHGYLPNVFSQTGLYTTAFAAQAIAAHDVVVLQAGEPATDADARRVSAASASPREPVIYQDAYEAAIDSLYKRGIIDKQRVGIIGFSRTVWYVEHMLAFSRYKITAAAITDGVDASYMQYLIMSFIGDEFARDIGAVPFGSQLATYISRSPAFNATRIRTPLRVEALGVAGLPFMWNIYAAVRLAGNAAVMNYIPEANHLLLRPSHRLSSAGGNVDWMLFWLKGEHTAIATRNDEYQRWESLRTEVRAKGGPR